jgi:hypothetical protein
MRKQSIQPRRAKLPPILEIDEDGIPVNEMETWNMRAGPPTPTPRA